MNDLKQALLELPTIKRIKELENLVPVFNEILYYQNQKSFLEKKISQKEIDEIYASFENKELTSRKH